MDDDNASDAGSECSHTSSTSGVSSVSRRSKVSRETAAERPVDKQISTKWIGGGGG